MAKSKEQSSGSPTHTISPDQTNILSSFAHYIRIDICAPSTRADQPFELLEFLRLACISVSHSTLMLLPRHLHANLVLWPSLFVFSASEAEQSASVRQHRGCFVLGIEVQGRSRGGAAIFAGKRFKALWEQNVRRHRIFVDEPVEPKAAIRVVKCEELGRLVVDRALWPQPNATALIMKADGFEASMRYYAPTEEEKPNLTTTAPQQKLRPASDVLHRLRWDPELNAAEYAVIYLDRFTGFQELPIAAWKSDTSDDEFIPLHRIVSFRDLSTGEIVWSRELRIDKIFNA